jgi:PilZ domain
VLDMTLKGARLRVPDVDLPNEFTLLLHPNSSLRRRCKVAWRKGFTLGLEFVQVSPNEQRRHSNAAAKTAKK